MVDYYETENYIFVHGWIPDVGDYKDFYGIDWRNYPANGRAWKDARWRNGMLAAATGDIVKIKLLCQVIGIVLGATPLSMKIRPRNGEVTLFLPPITAKALLRLMPVQHILVL